MAIMVLDGAILYPSLNVRKEHYNCHSCKCFCSYQHWLPSQAPFLCSLLSSLFFSLFSLSPLLHFSNTWRSNSTHMWQWMKCMASHVCFTQGLNFFYATLTTTWKVDVKFTTTRPFATLGDDKKTIIRSLFLPSKLLVEGAMGVLLTTHELVEIDVQ